MSLLTMAVMFLVTEGYGYLTQNTAQTQRDKTTQRSEELGAAVGRNQKGCLLASTETFFKAVRGSKGCSLFSPSLA